MSRQLLLAIAGLVCFSYTTLAADTVVRIGSKKFTESYVLGEIARAKLKAAGFDVNHKQGMGGTLILWTALKSGAIDVYPDYTGTIREEILKSPEAASVEALRDALKKFDVGITEPLGFENTYALVMLREKADSLAINRISDLGDHPDLVVGLNHEFLNRTDGWKPLSKHYDLAMTDVRGIDHTLGYIALEAGEIDVKEAYSTDAKISKYDLKVLEDDLDFFPEYEAVYLYRLALDQQVIDKLKKMVGTLSQNEMIRLNLLAEKTSSYKVAAIEFLTGNTSMTDNSFADLARNLARWTLRHLYLVTVSMIAAILAGIPLGIRAARHGLLRQMILGTTGMIFTIPSLALLALLVPVPGLGISSRTAIIALFLYSLLPIIRNTSEGLRSIPRSVRDPAEALGLSEMTCLVKVYLPMCSRTILAGIKTATVINIGTATLAALIGAGGLGEPIISGLNLNNHTVILQGALPAALLALGVQALFDAADKYLIPRGLTL